MAITVDSDIIPERFPKRLQVSLVLNGDGSLSHGSVLGGDRRRLFSQDSDAVVEAVYTLDMIISAQNVNWKVEAVETGDRDD